MNRLNRKAFFAIAFLLLFSIVGSTSKAATNITATSATVGGGCSGYESYPTTDWQMRMWIIEGGNWWGQWGPNWEITPGTVSGLKPNTQYAVFGLCSATKPYLCRIFSWGCGYY